MILLWHPLAIADREHIMDYIAADNLHSALALDEAFEIHAERALEHPHLYKPGRVAGTREIVVHPNYLLVYRFDDQTLTVLRVLHAARQWPGGSK